MRETIQKTAIATVLLGLALTLLCRGFASTLVAAFLDDATIIPLGVYVINIGTLPVLSLVFTNSLYYLLQSTENHPMPLCIRFTSGSHLYPCTLSPGSHCRFRGIVWAQPITQLLQRWGSASPLLCIIIKKIQADKAQI